MKKTLIFFFVFAVTMSSFSLIVDSTATMNSTELDTLHYACTGGDLVMTRMYGWYESRDRNDHPDDFREESRDYHSINISKDYVELAFEGIIETDSLSLNKARNHLLDPTYEEFDEETNQWVSHYLDLNILWTDEYATGSWSDCLSYGQLLINVSSIVDMLWEYNGGAYQDTLRTQLTSLAGWAYLVLQSTFYDANETVTIDSPVYPNTMKTGMGNGRIRLAAALGYAGCVLDSINYIRTAEYDLFGFTADGGDPPEGLGSNTIEGMTSEGNLYNEGMSYTRYILNALDFFFTSRNRTRNCGSGNTANHNWFTDAGVQIKNIYENSMDLISPDLACIPFDDVHYGSLKDFEWDYNLPDFDFVPSGAFTRPKSFSNMMTYYFQGDPSVSLESFIRGFVNRYYDKWAVYTQDYNFARFYTYDHNQTALIAGGSPQNFLSDADHQKNEEFTILRKTITTWNEFQEAATLFVNHEHSPYVTSHEDSDQSSFILYYKGKQMLIDPGYRPSWYQYYLCKEWLASAFAHNLILVDPVDGDDVLSIENLELNADYFNVRTDVEHWNDPNNDNENIYEFEEQDIEPSGEIYQTGITPDPAYRNYLVSNSNIKHLQVGINYERSQTDIIRNYYSMSLESDNPYFIVYDDVINENTLEKDFYNQLHFALHPTEVNDAYSTYTDDLDIDENGEFDYHSYYNDGGGANSPNNTPGHTYLFGTMGSINDAVWTRRDSLPQGLYFGKKWSNHPDSLQPPQWEHKCLRVKTTTSEDEKFLTLLFPSENADTPIEYAYSGDNYYLTKFHFSIDTTDVYSAVKTDENLSLPEEDLRFNTNASFFLVEANSDFSHFNKLIVNNGDTFEVEDITGTRFDDVLVFETDYEAEEIIAEYDDTSLYVTFKTDLNDYPKYKILHQNIDPENMFSKTEFGYYNPGTEPPYDRGTIDDNIKQLAYDDKYFYVNYDFSDLPNSADLVLYKGNYTDIFIEDKLTIGNGDIGLAGDVELAAGDSLIFLAGTKIELAADVEFDIDGVVMAIGDTSNVIEFMPESSGNWNGFTISSSGYGKFKYCKISGASTALKSYGRLICRNNEITENACGITLYSPIQYKISENLIDNNASFGIFLSYTIETGMYECYIEENEISKNKYGMYIFETNAEINDNNIHGSTLNGLFISHNSNPVITYNMIRDSRDLENDNPEIYLVDNSYPILDKKYNDIIIEREGSSESIHHADADPLSFYVCTKNYWGTIDDRMIEGSFYPASWCVIFDPFSLEQNTEYQRDGEPETLFEEGYLAERSGDPTTAKQKYLQSIAGSPDSLEAVWSASRLLNCVTDNSEYSDLQEYYDDLIDTSANPHLVKLSEYNSALCDRKQKNYQDAIFQYEELFTEEMPEVDSLFTMLDIVYTYLEADDNGGRAINLRFMEDSHSIRSLVHAKELERDILNELMSRTDDAGIYSPIIDNILLHNNYPNPFNPTTTISFSLPEESKVDISIYNIKGQKVKTLVNEDMERGIWKKFWDGKDDNDRAVSSGVYFYKLDVNGKTKSVKKCLLLK